MAEAKSVYSFIAASSNDVIVARTDSGVAQNEEHWSGVEMIVTYLEACEYL